MEEGNADKPMNLSNECDTGCFQRFCAVRVLATGKVWFRSVTCLIKIKTSLISEDHDLKLQADWSDFFLDKIKYTNGVLSVR